MIASVTDLDYNAIMIRSPINDDMMIVHHVPTTGGGIIDGIVEHFGIFDAGAKATPLKYNPKGLLAINEVEVP